MITEETNTESEVSISIMDILKVMKKKWLYILLITAVFFAIGYVYVSRKKPTYSIKAMYMVTADAGTDTTIGGDGVIPERNSASVSLGKAYKSLYLSEIQNNSNTMMRTLRYWLVAKYGYTLSELPSLSSLRGAITAQSDDDDYFIIYVTVKTGSAQLTKDVSAALADILSDAYKKDAAYPAFFALSQGISPLPAAATPETRDAFRTELAAIGIAYDNTNDSAYDTLSDSMRDMDTRFGEEKPTVEDASYICAFIAKSSIYFRDAQANPGVQRTSSAYILVIALLGFILAVALFTILHMFDTKIRTEEDLRRCCPYPILAKIPAMHSKKN